MLPGVRQRRELPEGAAGLSREGAGRRAELLKQGARTADRG